MQFTAKIRKVGNSLGVLLPKACGLQIGDTVQFDILPTDLAEEVITDIQKVITKKTENVITETMVDPTEIEEAKKQLINTPLAQLEKEGIWIPNWRKAMG